MNQNRGNKKKTEKSLVQDYKILWVGKQKKN